MISRLFAIVTIIIALIISMTGCNTDKTKTGQITVSAAASLSEVMKEISDQYQEQNPDAEITLNYASSGVLKHQIENGAPTDLFISASVKYMDELEEIGLIEEGTRQDLLMNEIVLLIALDSNLVTFEDLKKDSIERITIGTPESAPVGRYAREVLVSLDIWDEVQPKVVLAKDVRQIIAYVESGNVDAGLSYRTDAKISPNVKISVEAPPESHNPITYPIGVIKGTKHPELTKDFQEYLMSEEAAEIFEAHGFTHFNSVNPSM